MAAQIQGVTLHSFGDVVWKTKRGATTQRKHQSEDNISSVKYSCLRFLFIDEVEACGAELLNNFETNITQQAKSIFKYASKKATRPRAYAGINVCYLGDFWQLPPTGQSHIMSNPFGVTALEDAGVAHIMTRFWRNDSIVESPLQSWSGDGSRVMSLTQNRRSGADEWFSYILTCCRKGNLSNTQYNFLHGFPTSVCGSWNEEEQRALCNQERCQSFPQRFAELAKRLRDDATIAWTNAWETLQASECIVCKRERISLFRTSDM